MIKHIVCFKLKDNSVEAKNKVKEVLLSMEGKVPTVKGIEVGCDFLESARSYDVILQVLLDNKEALDIYQDDEYHVNTVKAFLKTVMETCISLDYEI